jgi:iron(III) transport system substrate-binding protein
MGIVGRSWVTLVASFAAAAFATPASAIDEALIDAAKKEGKVVWYTALNVDQFARPFAEAFEKKFGIKVEYARVDAAQVALRIDAEGKARRVQADVFDGFGTPSLQRDGLVAKFAPEGVRRFSNDVVDPNSYWAATNMYVMTPAFNTDVVKKGQEPKTFEDLLDPKWKGKMAWNSRTSVIAAPGFVAVILKTMGDVKGREYLRKLATQDVANVDATVRAILDQIITGEYVLGIQMLNSQAVVSANQGAPAGWVAMKPASAVLSVVSLTAGAPHPNAGKLLIESMVSKEGQQFFHNANYVPVDPEVPPQDPSTRPGDSTFPAIVFTPEQIERELPGWKAVYNEIFH